MKLDFDTIQSILDSLKSAFLFLIAVLFGAGARISHRSQKEKLSRRQMVAVLTMALCIGYITDNIVTYLEYPKIRGGVVALSALFSEGLVNWMFKNETSIFGDLFRFFLRRSEGRDGNYKDYETGHKDGTIAEDLPENNLENENGDTDL